MENNGEKLLVKGQKLREQGKAFGAIDALNRALAAFVKERNYSRFAHTLLDRAICWQHLYQLNNNDFCFAVLHNKDAEAMLEIVQSKNIKAELSGAYFVNGKAQILFGNYKKATGFFNKALKNLPAAKNAQRGDWLTHLGKAIYLSGRKQAGIKEIFKGIGQLNKYSSQVDGYTYKVWLSGGYLRLAELLKNDSPKESKDYLKQAAAIIKSDLKQIMRKKQLKSFTKTGTTGF